MHTGVLFFAVFGAALFLVTVFMCLVAPQIKKRKFIKTCRKQFGQPPAISQGLLVGESFWSSVAEIRKEWPAPFVDDLTWYDLDMDEVFFRMNGCHTCLGDARLYSLLRDTAAPPEAAEGRERTMALFAGNENLYYEVQAVLHLLGRHGGNTLDLVYFRPQSLRLQNRWLYRLLALLPFAGIFAAFINPLYGIWISSLALVVNISVTMIYKAKHDYQFNAIRYFAAMIGCAKNLARMLAPHDKALSERLSAAVRSFDKITKSITVLKINELFTDGVGMICPLTPFLLPLLSYGKIAEKLVDWHPAIGELYQAVGDVDVSSALLSFRQSVECWCHPVFTSQSKVAFDQLCHPLLEEPVPNSAVFDNDVLVTGSNASGKSTFLKAIAVNCILAQTVNTCTAASFTLRKGSVATSMAVADNIIDGDSYFIAEIKSMLRLLKMAEQGFAYFFIDEILKGTNTIERISAAAEVIAYLHGQECLCFAATHDIELTGILAEQCENIHFRETIQEQGVYFDYQLKQGPSTSRNAILLLSRLGFPAEIYQRAAQRAEYFEANGQWLPSAREESGVL